MSYILDSLKKSEKERRSMDNPAAAVVDSPAFLENDRADIISNQWVMIILMALLVLVVSMYYWFFKSQANEPTSLLNTSHEVSSQALSRADEKQSVAKPAESLQAREAAVLLYEKALEAKKQPDVNSLYQKISDDSKASSTDINDTEEVQHETKRDDAQSLNAAAISASPTPTNPGITAVETPETEEAAETKNDAVIIPVIYELNSLTKRNIPALDYGAHIYATDNQSGFIILNGARRREGDQLDNGVFIEKIAEESVVLSYNGILFSLPAMKSWSGK